MGRWFAEQGNPGDSDGGIVWDAYYLYGPEAYWDSKPAPLLSTGTTVRDKAEELKNKLIPLLN